MSAAAFLYVIATVVLAEQRQNHVLVFDGREPVKSKSLVKLEIRRKADSPFILGGDEQLTAVERTGRRRRRHSSDPIPDPSTPPPFRVLARPVDTSVVVGSNARFDCLFQGDPYAAVLWYRNRTTKEHPNSVGTFLIATSQPTQLKYKIFLNNSLVIVNATHDDAGYYTCNLLRAYSGVDFQAKLYVDDEETEVPAPTQLPTIRHQTSTPFSKTRKPAVPTVPLIGAPEGQVKNLNVNVTGPRTIDVSWTYVDPGEAGKRPTNFLVFYVIKDPENTATSRSVSQKHTLTNLNPFTEYIVYVAAANSFGRGPLSESKTVKTRQDAPGPPVDVDIKTREGEGIIAVTWKAPDEPNGIITGYTIVYQVGGNTEVKASYPPETRSARIENLAIDELYTVSVFAITAGGDGQKASSEKVTVGRVSSTPFTQTVYFYIIIALAAIFALALLILVIVCVRRSRSTDQLEITKERLRRQRPPPSDRNSYATDDKLNNSVPSPLPYPDSSRQFFPPPPPRPAPTPTTASAAPSLQTTLSPRHAVPPFEPRHSPIGSLDQLKYGYAADGPDLELGRHGKRMRHGSKQAYGLSSYGTTGDIDSMKDRFSVEYSPGEKQRMGSMTAGEPVAGGLKPVHGY
ncbi:uncharacterized protein [Oscarella lobularis]|uniref:uncharacterized protein n=1 Tax=Oscarella lobularis TaxID=121494 RepID=UPI0033141BDE